jgi:hypothetical protein
MLLSYFWFISLHPLFHCFCCCCCCVRYVNGADPNRRLGSFRNLADVLGSTPTISLDPGLKDWRIIEGGYACQMLVVYLHG